MSAPPLSATALRNRLLRNYFIGTGSALAGGALLFTFGLDLTREQAALLFLVLGPLAFVPTIALDVWRIGREVRPIAAALNRAPDADYGRAVVRALNLPYYTGQRIVFLHLPAFLVSITLLVFIANAYFDFGLSANQYINLLLIAVLVSTSHGVFEYFAADNTIRTVLPWLWEQVEMLSPEARQRVVGMGMRRKLLLLSTFAVFAPLVILGTTTLVRTRDLLVRVGLAAGLDAGDVNAIMFDLQVWVLVLILASIGVMVTFAVVMALGITRAAKDMVTAMGKVEEGEFDTKLPVTTTDEFATLFHGFNLMTEGLNERERLRDAFGRYLAPELAEDVMKRGVQLGGHSVTVSIMFADIRGFTTLSESLTPEEVVDLLNRYFATVEPVIQQHGGWINKFGGDSLLAVFGEPTQHADHARRAVQAALGMRVAMAAFNREQCTNVEPEVHIGMGIHTGVIVAGNVGSPARMEYTVIGDVVNVASRIDGLNKEWDTDILVSADAWAAACLNGSVSAREMPPVALKGKSQLTRVYAID